MGLGLRGQREEGYLHVTLCETQTVGCRAVNGSHLRAGENREPVSYWVSNRNLLAALLWRKHALSFPPGGQINDGKQGMQETHLKRENLQGDELRA